MNFFISDALAAGDAAPQDGFLSLLPLILIFVVFYFLLIRPQTKRAKEHKALVAGLAKGDEIATNGGLLGRITQVDENFARVEIADGVQVRVQLHAVAALMPKGTVTKGGAKGKAEKSGKPEKAKKGEDNASSSD